MKLVWLMLPNRLSPPTQIAVRREIPAAEDERFPSNLSMLNLLPVKPTLIENQIHRRL